MSANIYSILDSGSRGLIVEAECHISNGLPAITIVGLGTKAVEEAKERIRSSFAESHIPLPRKRIVINLAPADVPKDSTSLDLAISIAILQSSGQIKHLLDEKTIVVGEIGLKGDMRAVRGILGKLIHAKRQGFTNFYIPYGNLAQALLIPGITIIPLKTIKQLYDGLNGNVELSKHTGNNVAPIGIRTKEDNDPFADIAGQEHAKRALQIAAAGGHNVLMSGPPGTGKTMLAKALPSLLPPLTKEEIVETTHLHSLVSGNYELLITERPFRSPHHSASHVAVVGGGASIRPGEISLAHRGILFLDEFPEFSRVTIEALRQPLEEQKIILSRAKDTVEYPANFVLVATANPCPCGYYGSSQACICAPFAIMRYRQKLSGPIMDRIDLYVEVTSIDHSQLLKASETQKSNVLRTSVLAARKLQHARFDNTTRLNSDMSNSDIKTKARLDSAAETLLNAASSKLNLSPRSYMRTIKVARTIADLAGDTEIKPEHISEAIQYRAPKFQPMD